MRNLEYHVEGFKNLAVEKLPNGLWDSLYNTVIGLMSVHLVARLCFRLFAEIKELEARIERLEGKR